MQKAKTNLRKLILYGTGSKNGRLSLADDNRGMTIVEVLMGFVILMIMMGFLSGIIAFSSNMLRESTDLRRAEQALQSCVYKRVPDPSAVKMADTVRLSNPKTGESVDIKSDLFQMQSANVLTGEETETLDVTVFYFKAP